MTERVLAPTESVCPECLARIPASRVLQDGDVYIEKTCPEHGKFHTAIWRGSPSLDLWVRQKIPAFPEAPSTQVRDGCPYDCGLCGEHRQQTCSVLFEVTSRCDLGCPFCYADSGVAPGEEWSLADITAWYGRLLTQGGPFNIQFSGGEPSLRDDLPEMITLGRSYGFTCFQLNTNGLRLAKDPAYLFRLKEAGLSTVFLQFDGTNDDINLQVRGRRLLEHKLAAIEACRKVGVGVILVPTLIPGVNTADIGNIIRLGLENIPAVRGVHFQPVSYFGRYPADPSDAMRITLPEVIRAIEDQTGRLMTSGMFCPPGCENAACSFHGSFIQMEDGKLRSLTRFPASVCGCQPESAARGAARAREFVAANWSSPSTGPQGETPCNPGFAEWDSFLERKRTHFFSISGMAFQDAWTLDLERLRDCCIHVALPDGRLVPFCAYNLTNRQGQPLYRKSASGAQALCPNENVPGNAQTVDR